MAKTTTRSRLTTTAERIGRTLGRAAGRIDRLRGKAKPKNSKGQRRSAAGARRRSEAKLATEMTERHDTSAAAKAEHAAERVKPRTRYRSQSR
jgi:hypothetical protein